MYVFTSLQSVFYQSQENIEIMCYHYPMIGNKDKFIQHKKIRISSVKLTIRYFNTNQKIYNKIK